ncbi:MAG: M13 family peptidase [Sphingobacteriaceae bacterium]|nr:MAG: M13 family peptidase [Sphingobacteriaceae bacterium]
MKPKLSHIVLSAVVCIAAYAFIDPPKKFIDPTNMDLSVKPGDDFFMYANGGWIKNNVIPAKSTRWGSFNVLIQENTNRLLAILNEASKAKAPKGSLKQRVGDMYASAMDSVTIEKRGYDPIKPYLQRIDNIKNTDELVDEVIYMKVNGIANPLFNFSVQPDSKYPTRNIADFSQGGTTLPDRDYYLKTDARTVQIQNAYKQYIVNLFTLVGMPQETAVKNADVIMKIETALAKAQLSRTELRDPTKTYHKLSVYDYTKLTPHIKWGQTLIKMKAPGQDSILVDEPDFFKTVDDELGSTIVNDWKIYLKWNVLKNSANALSSPFVNATFAFNSVLSGQKAPTPRNERVSSYIDANMGELLGQLYVKKYFTPAAKAYMINLVNNMKAVFRERINGLDWMSAATKQRALKKLDAFKVKIGYPDKWEPYTGLVITRDDYAGNLKRVAMWKYNFNVSKLGKPVDKTKFNMTPPTVNASYSPNNNDITFPAGILQFPFFDFGADDAVNYGGIAAVIGHEITHGFDDQGRQYDADGSLRDWWTKEDADKFKQRADKVVDQYNAYTVLDTIHINGRLTLGENLADLGGLSIAYEAFKKTKQGQSNTKIDGFTPDQRFFLSWAQVWRSKQRPEALAQRILTDPHSPEQFRGNAPLTNIDAWYTAFNVKPGDKLYKKPEDRIKIW